MLNYAVSMKSGLRVAVLGVVLATMGVLAPGCLNRPLEPQDSRITSTIVERLTQSAVDKIDLLLVIDNSRSMADKQEILELAVPDLVLQLVNPKCICDTDPNCAGGTPKGQPLPPANQPTDPTAMCDPGSKREFDPIFDFHLGIVTSSVGGHGADSCEGDQDPTENDHGHLIDRDATGASAGTVPTWNGKHFLVWDPKGDTHVPPGETNVQTLITNLASMVGGAGEVGCGYEAQLEGWYRFLVDPDPYETISIEMDANGVPKATLQGIDEPLRTMRRDFMRPDSLLAIIMLTDENDCSIRDGGQYFFAAQRYAPGTNNPYHLPKPRAACATNPNDPCCRSCGQGPGCVAYDPDDPTKCTQLCDESADDCSGALGTTEDAPNLRCFNQKQRFGIDFLYPIDRYVTGLTAPTVPDRTGQLVPNPVFSDLNPDDENSSVRDAGLVFVAGIVGVPWQDIARKNMNGQPDLVNGLNAANEVVGGFQDANEMLANDTWNVILGDPVNYVKPTDPLMIESIDPRSGSNPVTGDQLAQPGNPNGNPINGSEWTISKRDDLQYACIFPLLMSKDCLTAGSCDCKDPPDNTTNPLCNQTTNTLQDKAKGYPGVRELQVLKNTGSQGIVGSICPEQVTDDMAINFGYRPAINAIVERLKQALGGQCLPRSLTPDPSGQVPCLILEARKLAMGSCDQVCSTAGRRPIDQNHPAVNAAKEDPLYATAGWNCFCEIVQTTGDALTACQTQNVENPTTQGGGPVDGWCYVDAQSTPPVGNADIVEKCPDTERRIVRFVGQGKGAPGATLFITCAGE